MKGDNIVDRNRTWSVKCLPISTQSAVKSSDLDKFSYLSDIRIPNINNNDVLLLIGTDVPAAHIPIDMRFGEALDPYAIRTHLGWIVRGPISSTRTTDEIVVNFKQSSNEVTAPVGTSLDN